MLILGIETSCDETSVAVVKDGTEILGIKTFSQINKHEKFGGVVPEVASRIHVKVIHYLVAQLLEETNIKPRDLDYIAVTNCPGLIGALLVGVSFANAYAFALNKQVIGVNHLEAHIYAAFLNTTETPLLPAVALLVSGGHTSLIEVKNIGDYNVLGNTLDDAVGEAFDKTAKLLNLPYPGGPAINKISLSGNPKAFHFPRALLKNENFNFSFSGLKTSVLYEVTGIGMKNKKPLPLTEENTANVAASFQKAVIDVLVHKTAKAISKLHARSLIVCGGVAANSELKKAMIALALKNNIKAHIPPIQFCTDNAVMVAGLAYHKTNEAAVCVKEVFADRPLGSN